MTDKPTQLCKALNEKWLRLYGAESMSGNCGKLACLLRDALIRNGFKGYVAGGRVDGFPGNHAWVVCEGKSLDPSVNQFGNYDVINNGLKYVEERRMEFILQTKPSRAVSRRKKDKTQ